MICTNRDDLDHAVTVLSGMRFVPEWSSLGGLLQMDPVQLDRAITRLSDCLIPNVWYTTEHCLEVCLQAMPPIRRHVCIAALIHLFALGIIEVQRIDVNQRNRATVQWRRGASDFPPPGAIAVEPVPRRRG